MLVLPGGPKSALPKPLLALLVKNSCKGVVFMRRYYPDFFRWNAAAPGIRKESQDKREILARLFEASPDGLGVVWLTKM